MCGLAREDTLYPADRSPRLLLLENVVGLLLLFELLGHRVDIFLRGFPGTVKLLLHNDILLLSERLIELLDLVSQGIELVLRFLFLSFVHADNVQSLVIHWGGFSRDAVLYLFEHLRPMHIRASFLLLLEHRLVGQSLNDCIFRVDAMLLLLHGSGQAIIGGF